MLCSGAGRWQIICLETAALVPLPEVRGGERVVLGAVQKDNQEEMVQRPSLGGSQEVISDGFLGGDTSRLLGGSLKYDEFFL